MQRRILNLLFLAEIFIVIDFFCNFFGLVTSAKVLLGAMLVAWLLMNRFVRLPKKWHGVLVGTIPALAVLAVLLAYLPWKMTSGDLQYHSVDDGKAGLYADHSVMVIVPHEDDEINIAGDVIDQYIKYGSEVRVVFVTNGDYLDQAEMRLTEAIHACETMGVGQECVIFLGYGDQWREDGLHIYNTKADQICTSVGGYTATYGLATHPAYHQNNPYTRNNLMSDIKNVILEYRPDTLMCIDFDEHVDHRAVSFEFEEVIGEILKEHRDYKPTVLKAYAYNAAWFAENDYYVVNVLSTQNVFAAPYYQTPEIYEWENRLRFPIAAENRSRSLVHSQSYFALQQHKSQGADKHAGSIVNGDKVFWERRTESILYWATVETSSGNGSVLQDFKLLDCGDVADITRFPSDGTWVPLETDNRKEITITLDSPASIYEIVLYDNPSAEDNVKNAVITFDNGKTVETGPLKEAGGGTRIIVDQENVTTFQIRLEDTEGEYAGLTEVEAYSEKTLLPYTFIKIMDHQENFIYDYVMDGSGKEGFMLYTFGEQVAELSPEDYRISCDNVRCTAEISDGMIMVQCPVGEACTVTIISNADPDIADRVYIQNPTLFRRAAIVYAQKAEAFAYKVFSEDILEKTSLYKTLEKIQDIVKR